MNELKKIIEDEAEKYVSQEYNVKDFSRSEINNLEDLFIAGANFMAGLKDGWISVDMRLPEYDVPVVWIREDGFMWIEDLDDDGNSWDLPPHLNEVFGNQRPTHWIPLPSPPKTKT